MILSATLVRAGDIVHEHDWDLHATGSGTDVTGPYVTTTEFGPMHLHLGAFVNVDLRPLEDPV